MINLLPANEREAIMYARRNTGLVKWLVAILCAIVGIVLIIGAGQVIIDRSANQVAGQVEAGNAQLKAQKLSETKDEVESVSSSLKLATDVLSRQVILSELIPQIGAALPNGTALAGLKLSKIEGGIDLSVSASDYQTATQIQVNLEDPANKLFDKADINSIDCGSSEDPFYPCIVSLRALFTKDNPFNFINEGGQ